MSMRFSAMGAAALSNQSGTPQGAPAQGRARPGSTRPEAGGAAPASSPSAAAPAKAKPSRMLKPGYVMSLPSGEQVCLDSESNKVGWRRLDGVYFYKGQLGGTNGSVPHGAGSLKIEGSPGGQPFAVHGHWERGKLVTKKVVKVEYDNGDVYFGGVWVEEVERSESQGLPAAVGEDAGFCHYMAGFLIERNGQGEYKGAGRDGVRYYGRWKGDYRWGYGVQVYPDGGKYYGDWDANQRHGLGCYLDPDGSLYEGSYKRDERNGDGTVFLPNGTAVAGKWKGEAVEKARIDQRAFAPSLWAKTQAAAAQHLEYSVSRLSQNYPHSSQRDERQNISSLRWRRMQPLDSTVREMLEKQNHEGVFRRAIGQHISSTNKKALDGLDNSVTLTQLIALVRPSDYPALRPKLEAALRRWVYESLQNGASGLGRMASGFYRYFYFLYGTCGSADEVGAGPISRKYECGFLVPKGGSQAFKPSIPPKSRPMSFCNQYDHFAGCIHRGGCAKIRAPTLYNAHDDVLSFAVLLRHAAERSLYPALSDLLNKCGVVVNGTAAGGPMNMMNEVVVARVYPVLRNLYNSVFAEEDTKIYRKLLSLKAVTLDDIGATFARDPETEKMFPPYCDSIKDLLALPTNTSVERKLKTLRAIADEINNHTSVVLMKHSAAKGEAKRQESNHAHVNEYNSVMATHRKRANSANHNADVKVADVELDTNSSGMLLCGDESVGEWDALVPHAALEDGGSMVVTRPRDGSGGQGGSPPLPPAGLPHGRTASVSQPKPQIVGDTKRMTSAFFFQVNMSTHGSQDAAGVEGGAADDLFPINLYIFIKSRLPTPLSELTFLLDFTSYGFLFASSPDDGYRLATFQACMSYVLELDWSTRDAQKVLIPKSVLELRLKETAMSVVRNIRANRKDLYPVQGYCSHLTLMDYLPPLAWVEDLMLAIAAADIDEFVVHCGKRLLGVGSQDPLPAGFAKFFNTILQSVGMELMVAAECTCREDYAAFLRTAAPWLQDVEQVGLAAMEQTSALSQSPAMSPAQTLYRRSGDWEGAAAAALKDPASTSSGPAMPARFPYTVYIELERYAEWEAGRRKAMRSSKSFSVPSPTARSDTPGLLRGKTLRVDVAAAAGESPHPPPTPDNASPTSLASRMSLVDLHDPPAAHEGTGSDPAVADDGACAHQELPVVGTPVGGTPVSERTPPSPGAASGRASSRSSSSTSSSSDNAWTAMRSRFVPGRGKSMRGARSMHSAGASLMSARGSLGPASGGDASTHGLNMHVFFKEFYHSNLYQLLATCLSQPDS